MNFLIDECLSPRLVTLLNESGHEAVHVVDSGLQGRPDVEVMIRANTESRVLVSADTDFGELLVRNAAVLPSVIIFRGWTGQTNEQADLILGNLESIIEDLRAGSIVVITPDRIRVRRLGLDSPDP